MNGNQIIRIPYKYGELLKSMDKCEVGKLMIALFYKDKTELEGLTLTYYNIIIVDIENLENQVKKGQEGGKKGGRPRKEKTHRDINLKTPPLGNKKPKIKEDNINKDKIKEDNINIQYFSSEKLNNIFLDFIQHRKEIKKPLKETGINANINKLNDFLQKYTEEQVIGFIEDSIANSYQGIFDNEKKVVKGNGNKLLDDFYKTIQNKDIVNKIKIELQSYLYNFPNKEVTIGLLEQIKEKVTSG